MALARSTRTVKKVTSVLADPVPQFVSLVGSGANQTPFKVVKQAEAAAQDSEQDAARLTLARKVGATVVEVAQITFAKKSFKDVDAVREYMDKQGYAGYEIHEQGDYFVVPGSATDDLEGDLEQIVIAKGAVMTLGRVRSVRKSAEQVASEATGTDTAIPASATATADSVETSAKSSEAGTTHETSRKSIYTVSRFASIIGDISYMLEDVAWENEYYGTESPVPQSIKDWLQSGATIFETCAKEEVDKFVDRVKAMKSAKAAEKAATTDTAATPASDQEPTVATKNAAPEGTAPTAEQKSAETDASKAPVTSEKAAPAAGAPGAVETAEQAGFVDAAPPAIPSEGASEAGKVDPVAAAIAAAMATAMKSVGDIVASAIKPVADGLAAVQKSAKESDDKLASIEAGTRQSRKSGDHEDTTAPGTQAVAAKSDAQTKAIRHERRMRRDALGF